ncbi:DUF3802 domain-containing protein [Aliidiomarina minuta]|uniref:DUF3802 domain-containing protein n=1 Tax=Aliidiomarina minuta TaxID=880057 RepID=A0A432W406_9GAMM|nr:DUF3802 family protein [Aliidiomarina minuta]RUO24061.1 DUF3802 domain-containing protein [Aliidiomarina minuta]
MIVETDGYIELVQYLTEQLDVFEEKVPASEQAPFTVREQLEESLSDSIMRVCQQHDMDKDVRLDIVREADAILYDLEEVLASVLNTHPSPRQQEFINEFTGLVKNLLDDRLQRKVAS